MVFRRLSGSAAAVAAAVRPKRLFIDAEFERWLVGRERVRRVIVIYVFEVFAGGFDELGGVEVFGVGNVVKKGVALDGIFAVLAKPQGYGYRSRGKGASFNVNRVLHPTVVFTVGV